MENVQPTASDLEAARELLEKRPGLNPKDSRGIEASILYFAKMHSHFGSDRFALYMELRPPRSRLEQIYLRYWKKEISPEDLKREIKEEELRPIDLELLRDFIDVCCEKVEEYSGFLQQILATQVAEDTSLVLRVIAKLDRQVERFTKKRFLGRQIKAIVEFLEEVRVEKSIGLASAGGRTAATAALLIYQIVDATEEYWKNCKSVASGGKTHLQYPYAISPWDLFRRCHFKTLPQPGDLLALISQEGAAAKTVLTSRTSTQARETQHSNVVNIQTSTVVIQPHQVDAGSEIKDPPAEPSAKMAVQLWSDLALAVDEHFSVWAFPKVPAFGAKIRKQDGVTLMLSGKRWKVVFDLASKSSDGRSISTEDLLTGFDYYARPSNLDYDSRARRKEIQEAQGNEQGLRTEQIKTLKKLKAALDDLRRELRHNIDVPDDKLPKPLLLCGVQVSLGFCVRAMISDGNGHFLFGEKPMA